MRDMKTERMWKDEGSGTGGCPALERVIEGPDGYLVVGKLVSPATLAQVEQVGPDETAVWVPRNVLDRLRAGE